MLLAIDIGNTNITLGLWNGEKWVQQWRLRTVHDMTVDEYGVYLKTLVREAGANGEVDSAIMSSVVPPLTATFGDVCHNYVGRKPLLVDANSNTGIKVLTEHPEEVGADRIVNAAAAHFLYGVDCIVVDMGTATTFDAITADGQLLGVAIAPGLGLAAEALSSRAAQLGRVALVAPPNAIGRNTVQAMQSGLIYGYVSLIEGMIRRFTAEFGSDDIKVIATGGLIRAIVPHTSVIHYYQPWLTLTGLQVINDMNR